MESSIFSLSYARLHSSLIETFINLSSGLDIDELGALDVFWVGSSDVELDRMGDGIAWELLLLMGATVGIAPAPFRLASSLSGICFFVLFLNTLLNFPSSHCSRSADVDLFVMIMNAVPNFTIQ